VKKVEYFFGVEALPEGSILAFPIAVKEKINTDKEVKWKDALELTEWQLSKNLEPQKATSKELYFGGLESIGFGRCNVTVSGKYFEEQPKS